MGTDTLSSFEAFVAVQADDGVTRGIETQSAADLGEGDLTVRVLWSSVNYKDALATIADGKVARISPLVPGIDLVGEVIEDDSGTFPAGAVVIAHGNDLGVSHHGGYAQVARFPAAWAFPIPQGLDPRAAMAIGTAGYTAGLSVQALLERGLTPADGPVLVTGATGGVGSFAVALLSRGGFEVVASSGKAEAAAWLKEIGASDVIDRAELSEAGGRPLERGVWAAAVDSVGGATLANVLKRLKYGGAVAASGNTGGMALETTVLPFILRGVSLLGIDSVATPTPARRDTWAWIADQLAGHPLLAEPQEVALHDVATALDRVLAGGMQGRTVVRVGA